MVGSDAFGAVCFRLFALNIVNLARAQKTAAIAALAGVRSSLLLGATMAVFNAALPTLAAANVICQRHLRHRFERVPDGRLQLCRAGWCRGKAVNAHWRVEKRGKPWAAGATAARDSDLAVGTRRPFMAASVHLDAPSHWPASGRSTGGGGKAEKRRAHRAH